MQYTYRPIYGYHAKEHQLFKVYFYNPITRKHSYDLLLVKISNIISNTCVRNIQNFCICIVQNGAVLKKILQPCEAHIPFILQFLMDFNLQGMNFVHLRKALARRKPGISLDNFCVNFEFDLDQIII